MKYLVTGSAGLIGTQLVSDLIQSGETVYSCYHTKITQNGISTQLDLLNFDKISTTLQKLKPDVIIHLAALTDVEKCELDSNLALSINAKSSEIIAKESKKFGSYLIYLSTDYIFDGKKGMYDESDLANPINQYGKSKFLGEKNIESFASKWSILRTSTPFGFHSTKKTFPIWVLENIQNKKKFNALDDQFTSPTYVVNLSKMILEISLKKLEGIFHLSGSTRISRYEFGKKILKKLNIDDSLLNPVKTNSMQWHAKRPFDSSLNVTKANSILTTKPFSIDESLIDYIPRLKNSFSL